MKPQGQRVEAYGRGLEYLDYNEPDQAIAAFTEAIRLDPRHVQAHFARGYAWAERRTWSGAIADFSEAIRLGSAYAAAYYNRAAAYRARRRRPGRHRRRPIRPTQGQGRNRYSFAPTPSLPLLDGLQHRFLLLGGQHAEELAEDLLGQSLAVFVEVGESSSARRSRWWPSERLRWSPGSSSRRPWPLSSPRPPLSSDRPSGCLLAFRAVPSASARIPSSGRDLRFLVGAEIEVFEHGVEPFPTEAARSPGRARSLAG